MKYIALNHEIIEALKIVVKKDTRHKWSGNLNSYKEFRLPLHMSLHNVFHPSQRTFIP